MEREEIVRRLQEAKPKLDALGVESLSLFGSVVRGEAGPESDIDVLVRFRGTASFDQYMDLRFLLEELLGRRMDLVTEQALRPEIRPHIENDLMRVA